MNIKDIAKEFKLDEKVIRRLFKANNFTTKNQDQVKKVRQYLRQELNRQQMMMRKKMAEMNDEKDNILNK